MMTTHPETTPALATAFALQRSAYASNPMPPLQQRRDMLHKLRAALLQYRNDLADAVYADFGGRSRDETLIAEIFPCISSIDYTLRHLRSWMQPQQRHVDLLFQPANARVIFQPRGVVGIIAPFNYPLNLAVVPLVAALAAGNRALLKMSEHTPQTAALLQRILGEYFTEDQVAVITGDAHIAAEFARLPFDHLLFTGSTAIGRKVMQAAADNLTPVTLELGGKSPVIIAEDAGLKDCVEKLCFAKSLNAGQTCVAPDYVLLPRKHVESFIQLYRHTYQRMFPGINGNPDHTAIINAHALQRLQDWLQDAAAKGARIITASDESITDGSTRMPLHLVTNVTDEMQIMQHELFGPILPLLPYDHLDEALDYINRHPRPLSLYLFSHNTALQQKVSERTHAGSMCINDALLQVGIDDLPFGGIGHSGMGQYHGREGFVAMSHAKSIMHKGRINTTRLLYPPYGGRVQRWLIKWLFR